MKFTFRLERLLHLREAAEKQQATELGRAAAAEAERRQASESSAELLDTVQTQLSESAGEGIAAGLYHAYGLTMEAAAAQREEAEDALRDAEEKRLAEEERFNELRVARRAVERLRERRVEEWQVESSRAEQKDLDEVAQRHSPRGDQPT